jgi:hypothetical protein
VADSGSLKIERVGGLAGFGLPNSRVRSQGQVDLSTLSSVDQDRIDSLFAGDHARATTGADGFSYRLTRKAASGVESVEVPEQLVPHAVTSAVKDELI